MGQIWTVVYSKLARIWLPYLARSLCRVWTESAPNNFATWVSPAGRFQYKRPAVKGPVEGKSLMYPLLRLAGANLGIIA